MGALVTVQRQVRLSLWVALGGIQLSTHVYIGLLSAPILLLYWVHRKAGVILHYEGIVNSDMDRMVELE